MTWRFVCNVYMDISHISVYVRVQIYACIHTHTQNILIF